MKSIYFDLIGGISGDMTVSALLDLGLDLKYLRGELKKIAFSGYSLKKTKVMRGHIQAAKFDVKVIDKKNFSYNQVKRLIKTSRLTADVKVKILKVYEVLADAEKKVHGHKHEDMHFEQLGDIDSILDIASACIGLNKLGFTKVFYSAVPINRDVAGATFELLIGCNVYFSGLEGENVTPTGMAILSALGEQVKTLKKENFVFGRRGYGAGAMDFANKANVLRISEIKNESVKIETEEVFVVEANIDDMNPQFFENIFDKLFDVGCLDVFLSSVIMKKSRPGILLTVLSNEQFLGKIATLILQETTSSGVRFYPVKRLKTERCFKAVLYKGHKIRVKCMRLPDGSLRYAPEYDDCKKVSRLVRMPLAKIFDVVKTKAERI